MVEVSPSICMSSSDLKRLLASCSESDPLWEHSASTSSMKMMLGEKYLNEHLYRVGLVVWQLGWADLDLGSSPGWWAATVATYCPSRMVEHSKSKST